MSRTQVASVAGESGLAQPLAAFQGLVIISRIVERAKAGSTRVLGRWFCSQLFSQVITIRDDLTFNEAQFMAGGRTVMGILGGNSDGARFLTELLEHHLAGRFPYERLIETFPFEQINEAVEASESGRVVKPVLVMGPE